MMHFFNSFSSAKYKALFEKIIISKKIKIYPIYNYIPILAYKTNKKTEIYIFNKKINDNSSINIPFNTLKNKYNIFLYNYDKIDVIDNIIRNNLELNITDINKIYNLLNIYIQKYFELKDSKENKLSLIINKIEQEFINIIKNNIDEPSEHYLITFDNKLFIIIKYYKQNDIKDKIITEIDKQLFNNTNFLTNTKLLKMINKSIELQYNKNISFDKNPYMYYNIILNQFILPNIPENKIIDREVKAIYLKRIFYNNINYIKQNYNNDLQNYIKWINKTNQININELIILNLVFMIYKYINVLHKL